MIRNKFLKVFLVMFLAFFVSACQSEITTTSTIEETEIANDNEIEEQSEDEVIVEKRQVDGGEMTIAIMPPKTFNPLLNEDIYVDRMLNLLFQDLYVLDENRKPEKNLIDSAIPNYVDNTLTLKLKNNLKWHDGNQITSDDFVYSIQVLQQASENAIYKSMVKNIVSYTQVDELTLTIQYNDSKYLMGYDLLFPIIQKEYYMNATTENNRDFVPVGNGYFKFKERIDSKNYLLERDETKEDMAFIDTINVIVLRDRDTELYAFERSNIDLVITDLQEWGNYQVVKNPNIYEYTNQVFEFLGFNLDRMIVSDKYFREIIAYSIDSSEIVSRLYLKKGKATNTFVNPSSWLYESDVTSYKKSFDKINEIIEKNYNFDEEENILYKTINGLEKKVEFTIIVNEDNAARVSTAEYIKNNLTNFGINVDIQILTYDEYVSRIESGNYDLVLGGYRFDSDQDMTKFLTDNIFNYTSETLTNRINAFNSATDETSYDLSLGELQKLVATDLPFVSLLYSENTLLTDEDLIIPDMPSYSNLFSNVNEWYWVR